MKLDKGYNIEVPKRDDYVISPRLLQEWMRNKDINCNYNAPFVGNFWQKVKKEYEQRYTDVYFFSNQIIEELVRKITLYPSWQPMMLDWGTKINQTPVSGHHVPDNEWLRLFTRNALGIKKHWKTEETLDSMKFTMDAPHWGRAIYRLSASRGQSVISPIEIITQCQQHYHVLTIDDPKREEEKMPLLEVRLAENVSLPKTRTVETEMYTYHESVIPIKDKEASNVTNHASQLLREKLDKLKNQP